jgi:hypothetical protein
MPEKIAFGKGCLLGSCGHASFLVCSWRPCSRLQPTTGQVRPLPSRFAAFSLLFPFLLVSHLFCCLFVWVCDSFSAPPLLACVCWFPF